MIRVPRRSAALVAAAAVTHTGGASLVRWLRHRRADYRIHILAYHDVTDRGRELEGVVSVSRFRSHIRHLKECFEIVPIADAVAMLEARVPLRRDYAVLTLDDGYVGNYEHAFPVLVEENVTATVFVTSGFLDGSPLWFDVARRSLDEATRRAPALSPELRARLSSTFGSWPPAGGDGGEVMKALPGHVRRELLEALLQECGPIAPSVRALRWDQVRDMAKAGMEIGCHTVSHPILSRIGASEQREEIVGARDRIASEIGKAPRFFAYPNGSARDFTADTVRILAEAGFVAACSTIRGPNTPGCDLYRLKRIGVGADPCFLLEARLCGLFDDGLRRHMPAKRSRAPSVLEESV